MHKDFADWYRQINVEPTDDQLKRRWSGVEAWIKTGFTSTTSATETARIFVTGETADPNVLESFVQCFRNDDTAFDKRNTVEIQVLAGAAIASQLELRTRASRQYIMAGLAAEAAVFGRMQGKTPPEILDSVRQSLSRLAFERRMINPPPQDNATSPKLIRAATELEGATYPSHAELGKAVGAHLKKAAESLGNTDAAVRLVLASTHRLAEEIDVLWWFEGRASRGLKISWRDLGDKRAIPLIVAKELAELTTVAPGFEAASALLGRILDENSVDKISIGEAVGFTPHEWVVATVDSLGPELKQLTPVVSAMLQCSHAPKGSDWKKGYLGSVGISAKDEHSAIALATQAYREFVLLKFITNE